MESTDKNTRSISGLLERLANKHDETEKIKVGELVEILKQRGFGLLLILFCAIPALPIPAQGIATILAIPVIIIALQMILGMKEPWIPSYISKKTISSKKVKTVANLFIPYVKKFEYISKPRFLYMTSILGEKLIGLMVLFCAISMALPIPFSNTIPSIGIVVMALGLLERDGIAVKVGILIGIVGITVTTTIIIIGQQAMSEVIDFFKTLF